jgi:hypothetical protein
VERVRYRTHISAATLILLVLFFAAQSSWACSRVYTHVKVKSTFVVFVHDPSGKPLSDVKITAYEFIRKPPHSELAAVGVTDKDGKAAIGLGQDDYSIGAIRAGVSSEVAQIDVYDDGSGASQISLTWPGGPITEIQHVSGVLGLDKGKYPWADAEIALEGPASEDSIGQTESDSQGRFKFGGIPPGFYALHVKAKVPNPVRLPQLEGNIAIRVSDNATNYELPTWGYVASSCGLSAYKDAQSMIIFSP